MRSLDIASTRLLSAGDISITSRNNTNLNASKDTYNSSTRSNSWSESITLASTTAGGKELDAVVQAAQASLNLAMSKAKGDASSTTYNNSSLTAENGTIKINSIGTTSSGSQTGGDALISGANLLADNITLNTGGNLTVESLQDSYKSKSSSFGMNLGIGGGSSGGGNASFGINYGSSINVKTDLQSADALNQKMKDFKEGFQISLADTIANPETNPAVKAGAFGVLSGSIFIPENVWEVGLMGVGAGSGRLRALSEIYPQESFFSGTRYTDKVIGQMKSEPFHSFPESVTAFEKNGTISTITGGDGKVRQILKYRENMVIRQEILNL